MKLGTPATPGSPRSPGTEKPSSRRVCTHHAGRPARVDTGFDLGDAGAVGVPDVLLAHFLNRLPNRLYRQVNFLDAHTEWRHQHNDVSNRPGEQSVFSRRSADPRACLSPPLEWFAVGATKFNSRGKSTLPDTPHERGCLQRAKPLR